MCLRLPPLVFVDFIFISAHVVTGAQHKISGQRARDIADHVVLRAALGNADAAVENIESGEAHFQSVLFAQYPAYGSIPGGNILVEIETVVAVNGVIEVAFEEGFG